MDRTSVLVIAGLTHRIDGHVRTEKIDAHVRPMSKEASVTYLTLGPVPRDSDDIRYLQLAPTGIRVIDFIRLCIAAIRLARTGRYDVLASFSLVPYGMFALLGKIASGCPAHLGIIGMDLDVHARGWSGPGVRWLFRQFDAISIAGSVYNQRLIEVGVSPDRIHTILHPVDASFAVRRDGGVPSDDLLWVGRMSQEKDPVQFIEIVKRLRQRGQEVNATMVGDGPLFDAVEDAIDAAGLQECVTLAGWEANPAQYYRHTRLYVLTSKREMLPLTVVEAMTVGVPAVAPTIGAIPDIIEDGSNGFLLETHDTAAYVETIETALESGDLEDMGMRARQSTETLTMDAVGKSWASLFQSMLDSTTPATEPVIPGS